MAALGASDVSYTVTKNKKLEDGRKIVEVTLAFGDGSKTYPTGGVPLTKGKMGCPTVIDSIILDDQGSGGFVPRYDEANEKLMLFQSAGQASAPYSAAPLVEVANSVAPAAQTMKCTVIGY